MKNTVELTIGGNKYTFDYKWDAQTFADIVVPLAQQEASKSAGGPAEYTKIYNETIANYFNQFKETNTLPNPKGEGVIYGVDKKQITTYTGQLGKDDQTSDTTDKEKDTYSTLYANANNYVNSAYANASAARESSYSQAQQAREEAHALAEIQRKRGIVDASTMAERQKATYGANAESVGRMGLQVSGYSDYLNSQAYASGMAARQNANAQAIDIKRQALYQEAIARLDADKAYSQATAEADKTYYGMMNEIEAAEIADKKAKEAQEQANYGKLIDAILNGNGDINGGNVAAYALALGITDTKLLEDAQELATTYEENYPKTLTESDLLQINNAYDAAIQDGDYITAGDKYIEGTYNTASDEQKKTYLASFMVENITNVDDSQWKTIADKIAKGDYGTKGGERIKEAFSNSEYVASADSLGKNELKAVIDSGLLTDEAKSVLYVIYANKYEGKKMVSVYDNSYGRHSFGNFADGKKQDELIQGIKDMVIGAAKTSDGDTLEPGDWVPVNYGVTGFGGAPTYYKYIGNGVFEKQAKWADPEKEVVPQGFFKADGVVLKQKK